MLEGLFFFGLGLFTLAAVGHGLWLILAAIFRSFSGNGPSHGPRVAPRRSSCPACLNSLAAEDASCEVCGWPHRDPSPRAKRALAVAAMTRLAKDFRNRKWISSAAYLRMEAALQPSAEPTVALTDHPAPEAAAAPPEPAAAPSPPAAAAEANEVLELTDDDVLHDAAPTEPRGAAIAPLPPQPAQEEQAVPPPRPAPPIAPPPSRPLTPPHRAPQPAVAALPEPPRPSRSRLFSAFLEERNIRWGELIGGLLIIGSSIALVLSFWHDIAARPLLKFGLFNGVTAALFGIGLYVERRWRLPTTTEGLLLIAVLLVPLNFLAIAAFTLDSPPTDVLALGGEGASIALFAGLTYAAGRILVRHGAIGLALGVVGSSAWELIVRRFAEPGQSHAVLFLLAAVPIAAYALPVAVAVRRLRDDAPCGEVEANRLFKLIGTTLFAALLPLGLILVKSHEFTTTLARLSPFVGLLGGPLAAAGLVLARRLTDPREMKERLAGTAIAVAGLGVMVLGTGLGWPLPAGLLPSAVVNGALLVAIGLRYRAVVAYLPAALCWTAAYALGVQLVTGRLAWENADPATTLAALLSGSTGTALVAPALLCGLLAWLAHGRCHATNETESVPTFDRAWPWLAAAAATIGAVSLVLVTWRGFARHGDPIGATWVYAAYAAASLAAAGRFQLCAAGYFGATLLGAAFAQGLVYGLGVHLPWPDRWPLVCLAHAATALALARFFPTRDRRDCSAATGPLVESAIVSSWLALPLVANNLFEGAVMPAAVGFTWLTIIWGRLAQQTRSRNWFALFQTIGFVAAGAWAHLVVRRQDWYAAAVDYPGLLDPRAIQTYLLVWTALCGAWTTLRIALRSRAEAIVDRLVFGGLVVVAIALAIYAAVPGVCRELSPRNVPLAAERAVPAIEHFEWGNIPHAPAAQGGTWLLLAALAAVAVLGLREEFRERKLVALIALGAAVAPLVAARWDGEVATASALRWASAAAFALGSIPFWTRDAWKSSLARWVPVEAQRDGLAQRLFLWLIVCSLSPTAAILVGFTLSAVSRYAMDFELASKLFTWGVAAAMALALAGVMTTTRERLDRALGRRWTALGAPLIGVLGVAPFVAALLFLIAVALKASPIWGPEPNSFFARIGLAVSYVVPVLVIAATLVGHAVVNRSPATAFAASLVLNLAATAGYLLAIAKEGLHFDVALWTRLAQLNGAVAAAFALAWLGVLRLRKSTPLAEPTKEQELGAPSSWLSLQTALAGALEMIAVFLGGALLWWHPELPGRIPATSADWVAWSAFALIVAATACYYRAQRVVVPVAAWTAAAFGLAVLIALATVRWDEGNLFAFRILVGLAAVTACATAGSGIVFHRRDDARFGPPRAVVFWSSLIGTFVVFSTFQAQSVIERTGCGQSHRLYFLILLGLMAALAARTAAWLALRWQLYVSALLGQLAGMWAWHDFVGPRFFERADIERTSGLVALIVLALPTPLWCLIELTFIAPRKPFAEQRRLPPLHCVTALLTLFGTLLATTRGLASDAIGQPLPAEPWLSGVLIAAMLMAVGAVLWDVAAKYAVLSFYVAGLTAVAAVLDQLNLAPTQLATAGVVCLAIYGLATSYLASRRGELADFAARLRIPRRVTFDAAGEPTAAGWLVVADHLLAVVVVLLAFWIVVLYESTTQRFAAASAILIQTFALAFLARGERRSLLQPRALELGVLWAVAFGWAFLQPDEPSVWLHRCITTVAALAAMIALYGLGFSKLLRNENAWTRAATDLVPQLIGVGAAAVVLVLSVEVLETWRHGVVALGPVPIAVMVAALVGLFAASLTAALVPGRDPLGLSERGRTIYVYAAELLIALTFLHLRLTVPWLFHGFFSRYWPLIVMIIAFVGVGLGEACRRRRQVILSEPLERTGALLPLLPVIGFWIVPAPGVHYSLLLVAVGMLYAALAVMRKSFGFSIVATLAANGGLWYFLQDLEGYSWFEHPQLWLIPPALCVLVSAQANRRRLTTEQLTSIRYSGSTVVYAASTADIFLNGTAEAPLLPLVLGALSLLGIFAGIALRVRQFLILGTSFLILALMTIIWHAAYDLGRTWLFYVTGIVVGILIIGLFALFEKKREELLRFVEQLREWDG